MKTIIELEREDNRSVGIYFDGSLYTAMTFTKSKTFKTESGARKWLSVNYTE